MQTGGYDIVAQISESMVNKSLSIAYYLGKFPSLKDKYSVPVNVPDEFRDFTELTFEVSITDPPVYHVQPQGIASLKINGQAKIILLGGIQVGTEAQIELTLIPNFNEVDHTLCINFSRCQIQDLTLTGFTDVPPQPRNA